jgi:S1-C subfamily serine protease
MRYLSGVVLVAIFVSTGIAGAVEMRTWTAASGGFTVEAELVELKAGDVVRLKTKDGREIEVPLALLSTADHAFVRPAAIAPTLTPPEKPSVQLARAMKAADRCRLPDEAIVVFKVFFDDPQSAPAEKAYAAGRLAELKDAAAKKLVRVNKKWVAQAEADAVRKKADELMRQGMELLKLDQEDGFKRKFTEAATLEPEEIRAEFLMALIYTFGRQGGKALPIFQKCLVRDPENVAVLNNVAMLAAAKREYATALSAWRRALEFGPDQRVVHNIGRFLEQSSETRSTIPKTILDGLSLPYAELTASGKFEETEEKIGWLLMLIEESDLDIALADDKNESNGEQKSPAPEPNDDGTVVGSGTGFVVHPGYVITNAHVAIDDATFEIQTLDGTRHKATRVAADKELDLALLKCEPLKAPPLVLHDAIVPRGTDVMLFGYPEMLVLGTSLKATRGSISSLPDAQAGSKYLYDAVSNPGNSGGPLCDAGANVVAVHSTGYNTASRYAGGVPSTRALEFVKKSLPEFQSTAPSAAKFEWPKVDERASAATMLIWVRKKNAAVSKVAAGGDVIELPFCLFCGGVGKVKCDRVGCTAGYLITRQGKLTCPACDGTPIYDCTVCAGIGIDARLASVQRAAAAIAVAKAAASSSTTSSTASSSTPNPSTTASAGTSRPAARGVSSSPASGTIVGPSLLPGRPVPAEATGNPVDLLAKVNPNQQYSPGSWKREGTAIVGGKTHWSRLSIPYIPPAEYDIVVEFQYLSGPTRPCFQMGLVSSAGRQMNVGTDPGMLGISVSRGAWTTDPVSGVDFTNPTKIRYMVRRNEVVVLINGVRFFHRTIDPAQISVTSGNDFNGDDLKRLFFGSQHSGSEWRITAMTLFPVAGGSSGNAATSTSPPPATGSTPGSSTSGSATPATVTSGTAISGTVGIGPSQRSTAENPVTPRFKTAAPPFAAGRPVDLLANTDPDQMYSPGRWKRERNAIVGGGTSTARFAVPYDLPSEYDLVLDVQELNRTSGSLSGLYVGLVSSTGNQFTMIVDDGYVGISAARGAAWTGSHVPDLRLGNPSQIRFLLRTSEVVVLVNGARMLHRTIDPDTVAPLRHFAMSGDDVKRLSIGSMGEATDWRITGMTLIPVK